MKGLILLANGFEDTEALTTRDILLRAGIEVDTCSINENRQVQSSFGIILLSDKPLLHSFDYSSYDFLVLPGGGRGVKNLSESKEAKSIILDFYNKNKLIAAICAAPSILGKMGLLKDKRFTCYAGFSQGYDGIFTGNEVEVDGNFITARSMKYSVDFGLAIINKLLGEEVKQKVITGIEGKTEKD